MEPKRYKVVHPAGIDLGGRIIIPLGKDFTPGVDVATVCEQLANAGKLKRLKEPERPLPDPPGGDPWKSPGQ